MDISSSTEKEVLVFLCHFNKQQKNFSSLFYLQDKQKKKKKKRKRKRKKRKKKKKKSQIIAFSLIFLNDN